MDRRTSIPELLSEVKTLDSQSHQSFRVLLNHMPLPVGPKSKVSPIMSTIRPQIVFVGHTHTSQIIQCFDCKDQSKRSLSTKELTTSFKGNGKPFTDNNVYRFQALGDSALHQIIVPTCSYRMGVPRMGYGAALIGETQCPYSHLPNTRTGTLNFDDVLRQIYVILTVLEMILRKFPVVWWLNQVSTTCKKEAMRLKKSVKFNHSGTLIRVLKVPVDFIKKSSIFLDNVFYF